MNQTVKVLGYFHKPGSIQVEDCAVDAGGYVTGLYSGKTAEEFEFEGAKLVSDAELRLRLEEAEDETYVNQPWRSITQQQWCDALEVLPPLNWRRLDLPPAMAQILKCVEVFQCSERMTGEVTSTYWALRHADGRESWFASYARTTMTDADAIEYVLRSLLAAEVAR